MDGSGEEGGGWLISCGLLAASMALEGEESWSAIVVENEILYGTKSDCRSASMIKVTFIIWVILRLNGANF